MSLHADDRYRVRLIIEDATALLSYFGKASESFIEVPVEMLTTFSKSLRNVVPSIITKLMGVKRIFQMNISAENFDPNDVAIKANKVFNKALFYMMLT